ncbi:MAG: hypothetical protein R2692_05745 [Microbacterium sp.]
MTASSTLSRPQLVHWRTAIFTLFLLSGVTFASWASRLPAVKQNLGIDDFEVGVLLFAMGAGSLAGVMSANVIVARWGARRGLSVTLVGVAVGLFIAALGVDALGSYPVAVAGLAIMGLCFGATDVMINVEAASVERAFGRTLMPLFHAFFSLGTVAGAGIGAVVVGGASGSRGTSGSLRCLARHHRFRAAVPADERTRRRRGDGDGARGANGCTPLPRWWRDPRNLRDRRDHPRHGVRRGQR